MTRLELYHAKPKQSRWKGLLLFVLLCIFITIGFFIFRYYYMSSIRMDPPKEDLGRKVVIQLPNGQKMFTYEKKIVKKDGKTYYQGDFNTIDLTGGKIEYKNWK